MSAAPPSWMLVRLALDTRAHHATADGDRLALLERATAARYRAFLATVYGFEARFEEVFASAPNIDAALVAARAKRDLLAADLEGLGIADPASLPACIAIPRFRTPAQAMGWLYVVERNTLLHGLLRRHLAMVIPDEMARASRYLGAYGDTPGARHRDLGFALDVLGSRGPTIPSQLVAAANDAFRCQRIWFVQQRDRVGEHQPPVASAS